MKTTLQKVSLLLVTVALLAIDVQLSTALAQGTAFTYQGRLDQGSAPANGNFDFQFRLYDAPTGGTQVPVIPLSPNVAVSNGIFSVAIDFGPNVFNGAAYWLEIAVQPHNGVSFTTLAPRQELFPVPGAMFASNASNAVNATVAASANSVLAANVSGTMSLGQLPATLVTNNATGVTLTGNFSGNGANLTSLNANDISSGTLSLARLPVAVVTNNSTNVSLAGTLSGNGAGMTNIPLAGLQVSPITNNQTAVSLSGVFSGNGANLTSLNANNLSSGTVPIGQLPSVVVTNNATGLILTGTFSGNGANVTNVNAASLNGLGATNFWQVGGNNVSSGQFIGSTNNQPVEIWVNNQRALRLAPGTQGINVIHGSTNNSVDSTVLFGTVGGGEGNIIQGFSNDGTIAGGYTNAIQSDTLNGTIGGGVANTIGVHSSDATIGGGAQNVISANGAGSTISGGGNNTINSIYATVPGGANNVAWAAYSFAAGQQAQAMHLGSFVWADSQASAFASTASDQFNVRAQGGARFVTGGAGMSVDGQPVLASSGISIQQNSSGAPNVIEGSPINLVSSGAVGATIGGGGATNYFDGISSRFYTNSVTADFGTVAGGADNIVSGRYANVGGGFSNYVNGVDSTIGGGYQNIVTGANAVVSGGQNNVAGGGASSIGGGGNNSATGLASFIGGGYDNLASGAGATVGGGGTDGSAFPGNRATGAGSTVPGGIANLASGKYSFAAGAVAQATNDGTFVWADSQGVGFSSTGVNQFLIRSGGGVGINTNNPNGAALNVNGTVVATSFSGNFSSGLVSTNVMPGFQGPNYQTVGGGLDNGVSSAYATVSGGYLNKALGDHDTVAGGFNNTANGGGPSAGGAFIGGGSQNTATALMTTVGGGYRNTANGQYATVSGGFTNSATATYAAVGGGFFNNATNSGATIAGGVNNLAGGQYSFAAGQQAQALHQGAFVWADSQNAVFASTAANQFDIRAAAGVGINKNNPATALDVSGTVTATAFSGSGTSLTSLNANNLSSGTVPVARLASSVVTNNYSNPTFNGSLTIANGSTSFSITPGYLFATASNNCVTLDIPGFGNKFAIWDNLYVSDNVYANGVQLTSDRNAKENFTPIDSEAMLEKVAALPLTQWNYKKEGADQKHVGPMAQDFHAAFGLNGDDDKHISAVDESGVALAAIQGLNEKLKEKDAEIADLKKNVAELRKMMEHLAPTK